jgi:hypothetical protein
MQYISKNNSNIIFYIMRIQHPGIANILGLPISWDCQYPGIANILGLPISWDCQYPGIAFCDAFDIEAD